MRTTHGQTQSCFRVRLGLLALVGFLGLDGCARLPSPGLLPEVKGGAHYRSASSFAAPSAAWPADRWWEGYGDEQLNDLIGNALLDSPDMAIAAARLRRAEAMVQIAGGARLPQLSAQASTTMEKMSDNYLTPRSMTPDGWQDYGRVSLDFSWEIDFWGKNRAALTAATSELAAHRAEEAQARLMLTTSLASAYAELARLFAAHDAATQAVEVRRRTASLFAERFLHGLEIKGSVRQADARHAIAESDLLLLDEQIGLQRNRLAALLGAGPDRGLSIVRPKVDLARDFGLPPQIAFDLLGRRPDVVVARLQAEAQSSRIDRKQAEFYPNVNLAAFVGVQSLGLDRLSREGSSIGSVGPAISLPIFNGGRLRGELKGARADFDAAVANYDRTVTQALQEVADVVVSQKGMGGQLEKILQGVDAARDAHRIARNRYEGGLANYLDVLSAEDALLTSLRTLTDLQSRAFSLDVALMRALGGGYAASEK